MKTVTSSVSPKGHVTIPVELRRQWGLGPKDRVTFVIEGDEVRLAPAPFTVRSAAGSVPALRQPVSWAEVERIVRDERVRRVIDVMRRE